MVVMMDAKLLMLDDEEYLRYNSKNERNVHRSVEQIKEPVESVGIHLLFENTFYARLLITHKITINT